jgi:lysophospholipase L1-like esterase
MSLLGGYDGWNPAVRTPTWFLCGDSTMADYPPEVWPMTGWGTALRAMADGVFVENCAVCGRSSKSFVAEKRLSFVELCLRRGDKLLIQFGHNDEKMDVERATEARVTYPAYLGMYIDAARRQGAEPVLLTPIARRLFDENGVLKATHGEYPAAMRDLAAYRGVRLLDMEKATGDMLQQLGDEGSRALFNHQQPGHPNYPDGVQDNTHLCLAGAVRMAQLALALMQRGGEQA